jgi:hypothetical protein
MSEKEARKLIKGLSHEEKIQLREILLQIRKAEEKKETA